MEKHLGICLLSDAFPPVMDGVASVVLNYAKEIHNTHGSALAVVPRYPGEDYDYPFPVVSYPSLKTPKTGGYRTGLPYPGIIKDIKRYPVDIIHCHCPFMSAIISKILKKSTGAPVIMTYHTKYDIDIETNFDLEIVQSTVKKLLVANIEFCDEIWAVSRAAGENLKSLGYEGDYFVMDNGVDFPKEPASPEQVSAVVSELQIDLGIGNTPVFLFVGRMMWYKGIKIILEGLRKVKSGGSPFKMIFVGGGADFGEITAFAKSLDLEDECVFTGPVMDRDKLRAIYSCADLFLFPSTFDSAPIAVREASACGLASILVRGSSSAEPVTDRKNAVLIDENADSLASEILALSKNREYMKALGTRALNDLYLPWDIAIGRAYDRYNVVLEKHKRKVKVRRAQKNKTKSTSTAG